MTYVTIVRVSAEKRHGALCTLVRLLAKMAVHVRLELEALAEPGRTQSARVLHDALMDDADVSTKIALLGERLSTRIAHARFGPRPVLCLQNAEEDYGLDRSIAS